MARTASAPIISTEGASDTTADGPHRSRTAMVALEPDTGLPRPGPWHARLAGVARTVRSVRWWLTLRQRAERVRRP
jgi:hypothetical protein